MCGIDSSDEDRGRSRRPGAEDRGWSSIGRVLGGRKIRRLDDDVCGGHRAQGHDERGFLRLASKLRSTVSPGSASKSVASGFLVLALNLTATVW
jgi:hypothetical protein